MADRRYLSGHAAAARSGVRGADKYAEAFYCRKMTHGDGITFQRDEQGQSAEREWRKMSGKKPRVSIAVPVYNGDNYLEYALKTALGANLCGF